MSSAKSPLFYGLDRGNSCSRLYAFYEDGREGAGAGEGEGEGEEIELKKKALEMPPKILLYSNVGNCTDSEGVEEILSSALNIIRIAELRKENFFLEMPCHYSKTLGEDRLVFSYYAFKTVPLPALTIDIGTFSTFDLVKTDGHHGGHIIPGPGLYYSSYERGAGTKNFLGGPRRTLHLPQNTSDAINSSYPFILEQLVNSYHSDHHLNSVIVSGARNLEFSEAFSEAATFIDSGVKRGFRAIFSGLGEYLTKGQT